MCGFQLVVPVGLFYSHLSIPHRFLASSFGHRQLFCHALSPLSLSLTAFWISVVCWALRGASEIRSSTASAILEPEVATLGRARKKKEGVTEYSMCGGRKEDDKRFLKNKTKTKKTQHWSFVKMSKTVHFTRQGHFVAV